jgi:hypothetical protein
MSIKDVLCQILMECKVYAYGAKGVRLWGNTLLCGVCLWGDGCMFMGAKVYIYGVSLGGRLSN